MLIVFLIDRAGLGDKSTVFSWLVKNSSKVGASKKKAVNEEILHCIMPYFLGLFWFWPK